MIGKLFKCSVFVSLLLFVNGLLAQQYNFQIFNYEQGLTSNDVVKIIQDKRGHLWFATMGGGIYRFNGRNFKNYTEKDGLGDNNVGSIVELSDGRLMILCLNCISIYDGKRFTNFTSKDGLELPGQWASTAIDNKGRLWIALWNADETRQLLYFDNNRFHDVTPSYPFLNVPETMLLSVSRNYNGNIVVNTKCKLYEIKDTILHESTLNAKPGLVGKWLNLIYTSADSTEYFVTFDKASQEKVIFSYKKGRTTLLDVPGNIYYWFFSGICEDNKHNLWIPSLMGVWRVNKEGRSFLFNENNGLPIDVVFSVALDNENNIWLSARGLGAVQFMGEQFITINEKDGLHSSRIYFNFKDSHGNIWFSTSVDQVCRYDGSVIKIFSVPEGIETLGYFETNDGKVVVLTTKGMFSALHPDGPQLNSEFGIKKDLTPRLAYNDGTNIWFVIDNSTLIKYDGNGITIYDTDDFGKETGTIDHIVRDTNNIIWFATNAGYMKYDGEHFVYTKYPENCISPDDIVVDKRNRVWIAVYGGLIKIDETGPHLYSSKQGLSSDYYLALSVAPDGKIFAGFSSGFDIISFKSDGTIASVKLFNQEDGFSASMLGSQNINIDSVGNLWFGTMQGLIRFNQNEVRSTLKPLATYITGIRLFYKEVNWESEIYKPFCDSVSSWFQMPVNLCLPYNQNHLTFGFEGICFSNPDAVWYQWKLEGLENDWSPITEETKAEYSNLSPGKYTFMVKSCNNDGIWNDKPAEFHFIINPPFWRTWWFITLALIIITGILAAIIRLIMYRKYRKKINELARLQEIEKIRTTLSKDIHDGAGASLSKIALLSESLKAEINGSANSLKKLNQISGLSRRVIDDFREIIWSTNPRYDNMAALMAYSRNYCNDLFENSGIECCLDFSDNGNDIYISPLKRQSFFLILKEAVHNVIKHSAATRCDVEIKVSPNNVSLKVGDNGKGFDKTQTGTFSNGLSNMNKRANACQGKFEIKSVPENGTTVLLDIPL